MATERAGRGRGWSAPELELMLTVVDTYLPLGANEWENVQLHYTRLMPSEFAVRPTDSIKRKYMELKNRKKPTGDPDCPVEVVRAKRIFRKIENRGGVVVFDGEPSEDAGGEDPVAPAEPTEPTTPPAEPLVLLTVPTPATPAPSATPATRSGLSFTELATLSTTLQTSAATTLSQSAQKRQRIDRLIDQIEEEADTTTRDLVSVFTAMEERASNRELAYRRERDQREAEREERRQKDREERDRARDLLEQQRADREQRRDELMMALMAKIIGDRS